MGTANHTMALSLWRFEKLRRDLDWFSYWFVFSSLFMGGVFLLFFPSVLNVFLREDSIAETSGAIFLFLTSIVLFCCSCGIYRDSGLKAKKDQIRLILFFFAGLAFFWAAGEEISWGQRIFDISTPERLAKLNQQKELNLHNLNTLFFNNGLETIILLAILVPSIYRIKGKERILGIILPSYSVILGFQLVSCYVTYSYMKPQDYLSYLMLAVLLISFHSHRDWTRMEQVFLNFILIIFLAVVNIHLRKSFPSNGPREFREYLFSFLCFVYSIEIALDMRKSCLSVKSGYPIY